MWVQVQKEESLDLFTFVWSGVKDGGSLSLGMVLVQPSLNFAFLNHGDTSVRVDGVLIESPFVSCCIWPQPARIRARSWCVEILMNLTDVHRWV